MADLLKWLNNTNFNESPERMSDVCTTSLKPVLYVGILSGKYDFSVDELIRYKDYGVS